MHDTEYNQREESIEGQLRECKKFAKHNDIQIVDSYIYRALSPGTNNSLLSPYVMRKKTMHQKMCGFCLFLSKIFAENIAFGFATTKSTLKESA